jgi:hypothetical protein
MSRLGNTHIFVARRKSASGVIDTYCIRPPPVVPCSALATIIIFIFILSAAFKLAAAKTPRRAGLLTTPNVAAFGPDWTCCGVGQQVRATDPNVT